MAGIVLDVTQDGPEFDPSIDENGNVVTLREPPLPNDLQLDAADLRNTAEIAAIEAQIEEEINRLKQAPLSIDPEDNQRGIRYGNDFISRVGDFFVPWACAADVGGVLVNPSYKFDRNQITCRVRFRYPDFQRGAAILEITAPRDLRAGDNPARQPFHLINIKVPAIKIAKFTYNEMPRSEVSQYFSKFPEPANPDLTKVGTLEISAGQVIVQGLIVPKLLTPEIQTKVDEIINQAHSASADQPLLIRAVIRIGEDDCTKQEVNNFSNSISKEQESDPINVWFTGAPRAQVLNLGNITKILQRPDIPLQSAETIYADSKEYQMHHIYAATYENDFIKLATTGWEDVNFFAKMVSMTSSILVRDSLPTSYLCFVNVQSHDVQIPEVGSRLKITLNIEPSAPTAALPSAPASDLSSAPAIALPSAPPACLSAALPAALQQPVVETLQLRVSQTETHTDTAEADDNDYLKDNIDDQDNYFDDYDDNLGDHKNPNQWNGIVIESVLTPPGHVCCLLERRREPDWLGEPDDRPFVSTVVPCISDRHRDIRSLEKALDTAPVVSVKIKPDFSQQSYKDEVRSCDTLFSSLLQNKISLRNYILCPTKGDESPVDLVSHMGDLDTIKNFSPSQLEYYKSLAKVHKGISLLNAPFGTGKTK
jgi:hypothetical protein